MLKKDLTLKAYHIQFGHDLNSNNKLFWVEMCRWFIRKLATDPDFLKQFWWSDEAQFQLYGVVKSKNNIFWGNEKPKEIALRSLYPKRCTAWCAMSERFCLLVNTHDKGLLLVIQQHDDRYRYSDESTTNHLYMFQSPQSEKQMKIQVQTQILCQFP